MQRLHRLWLPLARCNKSHQMEMRVTGESLPDRNDTK